MSYNFSAKQTDTHLSLVLQSADPSLVGPVQSNPLPSEVEQTLQNRRRAQSPEVSLNTKPLWASEPQALRNRLSLAKGKRR